MAESTIPEEEEAEKEGEEEEMEEGKTAFEKKELNWEEDMMLFSKYLDRKVSLAKKKTASFSLLSKIFGAMSYPLVFDWYPAMFLFEMTL